MELLSNINLCFSSSTSIISIVSPMPLLPNIFLFLTPNFNTSSQCLNSFPSAVSFMISIITDFKLKCTKMIIPPCNEYLTIPPLMNT